VSILTTLPYTVLGSSVFAITAVLFMFRAAAAKAGWSGAVQAKIVTRAGFIVVGWFALAAVLAVEGVYRGAPGSVPTIQFGLLTPILLGVLVMAYAPTVRRLLAAVPQAWLIAAQVYRSLGVTFLILFAAGHLPGAFALPAGIGDMITGLAAPFLAIAYARRPEENRSLVLLWNAFGLLDLVVAVTMGVLTSPSPLQLLAFDHPNLLIAAYPLVLIPTYLVPIAVLLHIASLSKLRRKESKAAAAS
jgi:hypothetical protein